MSRTCLIIPCYNEANRLDADAFAEFLSGAKDISICFGNDASTDGTLDVLQKIQSKYNERVFIVSHDKNRGKAEIVRKGVNEMYKLSRFDYFGYFDADLSAPLGACSGFIKYLEQNINCQAVFGSRIEKPGVVIKKIYLRHLAGRIFSLVVNYLFKLRLYDTQCGAKLFRKEIVPLVFNEPFISRWLFDIEIILRLRKFYLKDGGVIEEKPLLLWVNKKGSKITVADLLKLPKQMLEIKRRYRI
jgi:dolichyl-phosphate beta-glucosyltransferase